MYEDNLYYKIIGRYLKYEKGHDFRYEKPDIECLFINHCLYYGAFLYQENGFTPTVDILNCGFIKNNISIYFSRFHHRDVWGGPWNPAAISFTGDIIIFDTINGNKNFAAEIAIPIAFDPDLPPPPDHLNHRFIFKDDYTKEPYDKEEQYLEIERCLWYIKNFPDKFFDPEYMYYYDWQMGLAGTLFARKHYGENINDEKSIFHQYLKEYFQTVSFEKYKAGEERAPWEIFKELD